MLKTFLAFLTLIVVVNYVIAKPALQDKSLEQIIADSSIRFDGLYVAKTGEVNIPGNKMEIYTYIRFDTDGNAYTQTVNSYDPQKVASWLGKNGRFERKGKYRISGAAISFKGTNDESPDKQLEGAMSTEYNGKVAGDNKLFLKIKYNDGEEKEFWFEFVTAG